jgi:2-oxoglutarate ferredoxin oxidoreductase subunit delta
LQFAGISATFVTMSKKAKINQFKCKGCYYCIDVCRSGSITKSGQGNPKGYDYVVVDEKKCTGCGNCYTVCPDCCVDIIETEE